MSNWHDSDNGIKRFCEGGQKKKGGFVVRLSWKMLETFGVQVASILGKRNEKRKEKIREARRKARR